MPARKAGKKGGAKKGAATQRTAGVQGRRRVLTQTLINSVIDKRQWVMYAQPIWDVIAVGDAAEMRRAAQVTRAHLDDVQRSLARLDVAMRARKR